MLHFVVRDMGVGGGPPKDGNGCPATKHSIQGIIFAVPISQHGMRVPCIDEQHVVEFMHGFGLDKVHILAQQRGVHLALVPQLKHLHIAPRMFH